MIYKNIAILAYQAEYNLISQTHLLMSDSENKSSPPSAGGIVSTLINKITPLGIVSIIMAALILVAIITLVTIKNGGKVDIFGVTIESKSDNSNNDSTLVDHTHSDHEHDVYITAAELNILSSQFFTDNMTKDQLIDATQLLVSKANELESYKDQFSYKILKLENQIPKYGRYIDTRIQDDNRTNAYKSIQSVLKEINFYAGTIDGNQQSTNKALVDFQNYYNTRADSANAIRDEQLGIFGYKSLGHSGDIQTEKLDFVEGWRSRPSPGQQK